MNGFPELLPYGIHRMLGLLTLRNGRFRKLGQQPGSSRFRMFDELTNPVVHLLPMNSNGRQIIVR